jgi:hypothetical protein
MRPLVPRPSASSIGSIGRRLGHLSSFAAHAHCKSIRWIRFRSDRDARRQQRAFSGVSPQPFLVSEKAAKRDGDLPVTIALVSRWKRPRIVQCIAPQLRKLFQAVETFDKRWFDGGHGIGVCTENLIRVDDVMESLKLAE